MKPKTTLEPVEVLSHEAVEPESETPAHISSNPRPANLQQTQPTRLPIPEPVYAGFQGYRCWGLNE